MDKVLRTFIDQKQKIVEKEIKKLLPKSIMYPAIIHKAMRYSVLAGGKRIRPLLSIAVFDLLKGKSNTIISTACAIELIHTYSLIHDDLPCMDDDDLRRGKPTLHRVYGEAIAVLAGDSLCALAFDILSNSKNRKVTALMAHAIGSQGMIGGQVMDIVNEGKKITKKEMQYIHINKTGKLIAASLVAGALEANANQKLVKDINKWGEKLGLAFQIADDILNIRGSFKKMGKSVGSDVENKKNTYPSIFGLEESEKIAEKLVLDVKLSLKKYKNPVILNSLADYIITRLN